MVAPAESWKETLEKSSKPGSSHGRQDLPPLPWICPVLSGGSQELPAPSFWAKLAEVWRGESRNLLLAAESAGNKEQELLSERDEAVPSGVGKARVEQGYSALWGRNWQPWVQTPRRGNPSSPAGMGTALARGSGCTLCLGAAGTGACLSRHPWEEP